jgi:hypothetical protein
MTSDMIEPSETQHERMLRATLHEYAPADVDADAAWAAVAPRLASSRASGLAPGVMRTETKPQGHAVLAIPGGGRKALRGRHLLLIAATVSAIALLLAGAGIGAAYWGGYFGGDKAQQIANDGLYTTIGQSQTVGDVTITIDKVYADPGNTYIGLLIRVPASTASRYSHAVLNHLDVTTAAGQGVAGLNESCEPLPHDGSAEHCLIDAGPLLPNADAAHVTLTVDIGEVWLMHPSVHDPDVRTGPWHFTFTLPFHQRSLGPGGPYAQPTPGRAL